MQLVSGIIKDKMVGVSSTAPSLINSIFYKGENQMTAKSVSKICSVEGCESKRVGLGLCSKHWQRNKFHGDPTFTKIFTKAGNTHQENFWSKVAITADVNRCWEWLAGTISSGYGIFAVDKRRWLAHRYSYFLATGTEPQLYILHACDNRKCVNPNHLREGTAADNASDKVLRNRHLKGEAIYGSKLKESDINEIRDLLSIGHSTYTVAKRYSVGAETIRKIKIGKRWKHVQPVT